MARAIRHRLRRAVVTNWPLNPQIGSPCDSFTIGAAWVAAMLAALSHGPAVTPQPIAYHPTTPHDP